MPFGKIIEWLEKEKNLGVEQPNNAVLATITSTGIPHSRVVAIREIESDGLVFFTQKKTRKVSELLNNPSASMTFLFAMQQRQIILEGKAHPLSQKENEQFWEALPRERQLRFSARASMPEQVAQDLNLLEKRKDELSKQFDHQRIPMSTSYFGFRFIPETFIFYTLSSATFSEVIKYSKEKNDWKPQLILP
jgi:pyridoxamine 5'-phosphate oxidase